jgi:glycine/D-amino acid oxidase-like deaminating enzyme
VRIFEQTRALSYTSQGDGCVVHTAQGRIRCRKLVLATNAYIDQLDPALGQGHAGRHLYDCHRTLAGRRRPPVAAQQYGGIGQPVHPGLLPPDRGSQPAVWRQMHLFRPHAGQSYRQHACRPAAGVSATGPYRITHTWGGHIDITVPRTPDFGRRGNVYWAQGFSGHGVVPTCAAGRVLANAILGDEHLLQQFMRLSNPDFPAGRCCACPCRLPACCITACATTPSPASVTDRAAGRTA